MYVLPGIAREKNSGSDWILFIPVGSLQQNIC